MKSLNTFRLAPSEFTQLNTDEHSEQFDLNKDASTSPKQLNHPSPLYAASDHLKIVILIAVAIVAYIQFAFYGGLARKGRQQFGLMAGPFNQSTQTFEKILWIYTEALFEAEGMNQSIFLHHLNHTFHEQHYEVRFVNSWNAYDYLPDQEVVTRIGKTMQNSQIDEPVHNLLKLALLYQHGGVIFNTFDNVVVNDDLSWIESMFNATNTTENTHQFAMHPNDAQVFLYQLQDLPTQFKLSDIFIAAKSKSLLIKDAFDALQTLIRTGTHPFANEAGVLKRNEDRGIDYLPDGLQSVFNLVAVAERQSSNEQKFNARAHYKIQSLQRKNYIFFNKIGPWVQAELLLRNNYTKIFKSLNLQAPISFYFKVNSPKITGFIGAKAMYLNTQDPQPLPQHSLIKKVLSAPHNKEIFLDPLPQRKVQLCLIMMENLNKQQIEVARKAFDNQTYSNWKLILPSLEPVADQVESQKVKVLTGKSNKVHNIEKACSKHCNPKGYAVLLNFGENFNSVLALSEIAKTVTPRDTVGAFISLENNQSKIVKRSFPGFNRNWDGIVEPKIDRMQTMVNHLRIFSIGVFRYIPQMDLRDIFGKYFEDRLVFLMTLLEIVRFPLDMPFHFYLAKKYNQIMDIPVNYYFVSSQIFLRVPRLETINKEQLQRLRPRLQCEDIRQSMFQTLNSRIPFHKMFAFNPGDDFVSVDDRQGPDLIPKLIHQVWLGSKLPPAKEYFYRKTQKMYPNYEVKLWREENITLEKFPLTFDVLQTLLKFNKRSPYNKLASVTDILRHEVLYHEGGFWKDAGMNLLRPIFDNFLKYKLALAVDKTFRYRWEQGMCFFANMPRYDNLWRITNFRNINRMRIYDNYAMIVAGPIDFNQLLVGQEEYDPDIILMPYQTFYPAQLVQHPLGDLCTLRHEDLKGTEYVVQENGWYLLSNCSEIYPYAYGIEHNKFGGTWNKRDNLPK